MSKKKKNFRIWFNQVNQAVVDVVASTPEEAEEKAYRKWRRDYATPSACHIEESNRDHSN